jgi:hypothetical protein
LLGHVDCFCWDIFAPSLFLLGHVDCFLLGHVVLLIQ